MHHQVMVCHVICIHYNVAMTVMWWQSQHGRQIVPSVCVGYTSQLAGNAIVAVHMQAVMVPALTVALTLAAIKGAAM